ncbi:acid protease [Trametes polyzona]|nr:acid protease [Trametes polyzona]
MAIAAFTPASTRGFSVQAHQGPNVGLATRDDLTYTVNITLGGQEFTVLIDTGSTDLWINPRGRTIALTNTTHLPVNEAYGRGFIQGTLQFAELRVGEYVVPSQAFTYASKVSADFQVAVDGILGMAFDISFIHAAVAANWGQESARTLGRSFINNLYAQNPTLPNNFDIQLVRTDGHEAGSGTFVIGGHSPQFAHVAEKTKIPRLGTQQWTVAVDGMNINSKRFEFNRSSVTQAPEGKVVALLDTGFSLPPLPPAAVDAIYTQIPGSVFWPEQHAYLVPCNESIPLSFVLGGSEYSVHPLDITLPYATTVVKNGVRTPVTACLGTFQYFTLDPTKFTGYDLVLGDAFLRNVYASFDYGDYDPLTGTPGAPFVQLLDAPGKTPHSKTNFLKERGETLAKMPPTMEPSEFLLFTSPAARAAASSASKPPMASSTSDAHWADSSDGAIRATLATDSVSGGERSSWSDKFGAAALALLALNLLVGVTILGLAISMCIRSRRGRATSSYIPVSLK